MPSYFIDFVDDVLANRFHLRPKKYYLELIDLFLNLAQLFNHNASNYSNNNKAKKISCKFETSLSLRIICFLSSSFGLNYNE